MVAAPPTRTLTARTRRALHSVGDAFPQIHLLTNPEVLAGFEDGSRC